MKYIYFILLISNKQINVARSGDHIGTFFLKISTGEYSRPQAINCHIPSIFIVKRHGATTVRIQSIILNSKTRIRENAN